MERRVDVVRPVPGCVHLGVRADDVVVREQVPIALLLDRLAVLPHRADVATELGLREHDAELHDPILRTIAQTIPTDFTPDPPVSL